MTAGHWNFGEITQGNRFSEEIDKLFPSEIGNCFDSSFWQKFEQGKIEDRFSMVA